MKVDMQFLEQLEIGLKGDAALVKSADEGVFAAALEEALAGKVKADGKEVGEVIEKIAASFELTGEKLQELIDLEELLAEGDLLKGNDKEAALQLQQIAEKILLVFPEEFVKDNSADTAGTARQVDWSAIAADPKGKALLSKIIGDITASNDGELKLELKEALKEAGLFDQKAKAALSGADPPRETLKPISADEAAVLKEAIKARGADKAVEGKDKPAVAKEPSFEEKDKPAVAKEPSFEGKDKPAGAKEPSIKGKAGSEDLKGLTKGLEQSKKSNTEESIVKPEYTSKNDAQSAASQLKSEFGSEKGTEQAKVANAEKVASEQATAKAQKVPPTVGQDGLFQQAAVQGDDPLQPGKTLPPQLENLRESVMQQLEGRLTYFRETGSTPSEMRMTLHPPELGKVTVRVFSSKGQLSASILTESSMVRELLESSITELRQRMNMVNIQFEQLGSSASEQHFSGSERSAAGKHYGGNSSGNHSEEHGAFAEENESGPSREPPDQLSSGIEYWA